MTPTCLPMNRPAAIPSGTEWNKSAIPAPLSEIPELANANTGKITKEIAELEDKELLG